MITYDEHGGCYDHVPPPWGATPPDSTAGEFGFDFTRFGVRVPALTARDAAAPAFGDVLTLTAARTDDVLSGVTVPVSAAVSPAAGQLSHLEAIREELLSRHLPAGAHDIPPAGAVVIVE